MVRRNWIRGGALVLMVAAAGLPAVRADDKDSDRGQKDPQRTYKFLERRDVDRYWIGVHPLPIDDALKSHLGQKDRVMVQHVHPDSPADKAGVEAYDIVLKLGDRDISTRRDLTEAVAAADGKEVPLVVLRRGKELTLQIQPTKRPADLDVAMPKFDVEDVQKYLGKLKRHMDDDAGAFTWRVIGPGVVPWMTGDGADAKPFPDGLSITVAKENNQPAKITAKWEGHTYETTADKLEILPDNIRPYVERMLHGKSGADGWFDVEIEKLPGAGPWQIKKLKKALEGDGDHSQSKQGARQHVEIHKLDPGSLQELRKELEELRKEVDKLKSRD